MGTEPESVDAQKGTMQDIFARCLKKNIAQVRTLLGNRLIVRGISTYWPYIASIVEKINIQEVITVTLPMYARTHL
jgi:hypothetical protein